MSIDGQDEKRSSPRLPVFAGNAEITKIFGRKAPGGDRARILNWSRGGVLLRVPSPRRRFIFFQQEPLLRDADEIRCTLRLPPQYNDIEVHAAVVRVARAKDDPDLLEVGLRFDATTAEAKIEAMARLLEPRPRSPSLRLPKQSGSERAEKATSERVEKKASQRAEKKTSQRAEQKTSQRAEQKTSQRPEKKTSQRAEKKTSQRVAHPGARAAKKTSARAEEVALEAPKPGKSGRLQATPATSLELDMAPRQTLELRQSGRAARQSGRLR